MDKQICDCYETKIIGAPYFNYYTLKIEGKVKEVGVCYATRECAPCNCGGDRKKCDFYEEGEMDKQAKDFEKGWEEYKAKSKQEIEEMIGIIQNAVGGCAKHWAKLIAEELHKNRYRKITENAVVLTGEEYERWQGQTLNIKKVRKETAEKFAEAMKKCFNKSWFTVVDNEKAHKYIDEICKEITEGVK